MKHSLLASALAALVVVCHAPALAFKGKPAVDAETIVFAIGRDIAMLDAQVDNTGNSDRYHWQMYDGLYTFDKKGNLTPQIATGVKVSPDGLEYRFTMRTGVKCHNGATLTSKDAKFAFDRILDPAVKSTRRPYFADFIEAVSAPDPQTVVVKLKKPDAVFMNKVAAFVPLIPMEYTQGLATPEAFARAPVGCGPYKLVEQKIGQSVELARFDDYHGAKPGIRRLVFRVVPEASSRVNALMAGEVDMADGIAPADVARLKQSGGVDVIAVPMGSPLHVRLYANIPGTPLANPKVRLALNYAVDVDAIIKNVMHGIGKPLTTFISSYYPIGVDPALKPYGYDPARAKRLLAEAGYPNGFEVRLNCPNNRYVNDEKICQAVTAMWARIGVKASLVAENMATFSQKFQNFDSSLYMLGWGVATYDAQYMIQSLVRTRTSGADGNFNFSRISDPTVDRLTDAMKSEVDVAKRNAMIREALLRIKDEVLLIPIHHQMRPWAMKAGVTTVHRSDDRPEARFTSIR